MRTRIPLLQRFLVNFVVNPVTCCWEWQGKPDSYGYGTICEGGKKGRNRKAHRVAYELFVGPIPPGKQINHTCHVRHCVNPDHLYAGTHQDNMDDMKKSGRQRTPKGEKHPQAQIPDGVVDVVVEAYKSGKFTQRKLAKMVGVTQSTINRWVLGKRRT